MENFYFQQCRTPPPLPGSNFSGSWRRPRTERSSLGRHLDIEHGPGIPPSYLLRGLELRLMAKLLNSQHNSLPPHIPHSTTSSLTKIDVPRDGAGLGECFKLSTMKNAALDQEICQNSLTPRPSLKLPALLREFLSPLGYGVLTFSQRVFTPSKVVVADQKPSRYVRSFAAGAPQCLQS